MVFARDFVWENWYFQKKKQKIILFRESNFFFEDKFQPAPRQIEKPFRFCISDVYKGNNFGIAVGGKIESGLVSVGDKLLLMPLQEICTVKAIRSYNQQNVEYSVAGDNVDLSLIGLEINSLA